MASAQTMNFIPPWRLTQSHRSGFTSKDRARRPIQAPENGAASAPVGPGHGAQLRMLGQLRAPQQPKPASRFRRAHRSSC